MREYHGRSIPIRLPDGRVTYLGPISLLQTKSKKRARDITAQELRGVMAIWRDKWQYEFDQSGEAVFETIPHLLGIGDGGGSTEFVLDNANRALAAGYAVAILKGNGGTGEKYPLHPEDFSFLNRNLKAK